jgi:hypothetical protein
VETLLGPATRLQVPIAAIWTCEGDSKRAVKMQFGFCRILKRLRC